MSAWRGSAYFAREVHGALAYAEFRVGDLQQELGIVDARFAPGGRLERPGAAVVYWHVDDVTRRSSACSPSAPRPSSRWSSGGRGS